jgi:hypothetical protein
VIGAVIGWVWLAGSLVTFVRVALWLGARWAAEQAGGSSWDRGNRMAGWTALGLAAVLLWPLAVPAARLFRRGEQVEKTRRQLREELAKAEAELRRNGLM